MKRDTSNNYSMRRLLLLLLFLPLFGISQLNITDVGVGEYITLYLRSDGRVLSTHWGGYLGQNRDVTAVHSATNIVKVCGGQYQGLAINTSGQVYRMFKDNGNGGREGTVLVANDWQGNAFNGVSDVYGAFTSFMALKNGVPYCWGDNNFLGLSGWNGNPQPLQVPSGKTIVKLQPMEHVTNPASTTGAVLALANDGTVYRYHKGGGGVPVLQTGLPAGIVDIGAITQFVYFAATNSQLWAWGSLTQMIGLPAGTNTPTNVTAAWTSAGAQFPLKKMVSNWSSFHVLDNKNELFSIGENPHGVFGTGVQWPNWRTKHYYNPGTGQYDRAAYAWNFQITENVPTTSPVNTPGKFLDIWNEGTLSFQMWARDMGGVQLYSAGRGKANALGNGVVYNNLDALPEAANVPFFTKVNPLTVTWPTGGGPAFDTTSIAAPIAHAGIDQWVIGSTATLKGAGHQQGTLTVPTGTITSYTWSKVSGPAGGSITSPNSATTAVTGLQTGTYVYRLTVTSNVAGQSAQRDMNMFVTAANTAPTADAGTDKAITLPTSTTTLNGSGSDADGTISSYAWTQVSGTSAAITSPSSATTNITGLTTAGTRVFRLTVTDNNGATATDDVSVVVSPAPNTPPSANAGPDQSKTLPTNTATMAGSGSDADGTIVTILWTKQSGPSGGSITTPGSYTTGITGLQAGTYVYRLTVTDNAGGTAFDDMTITVASANVSPVAEAGGNVQLFLPTNSVQLSGSGGDSDGTIVSYAWSKVSGVGGTITDGDTPTPIIIGLSLGTYVYRLTVTDNSGGTATDDMQIQVLANPGGPKKLQRRFKIVP